MTDLATASTHDPAAPTITPPGDAVGQAEAGAPYPAPTNPHTGEERPPRRGRRFGAGFAAGLAVAALGAGGALLIERSGDATTSDTAAGDTAASGATAGDDAVEPAAADAASPTGSAANPPAADPAATVVPDGSSVYDIVVAVRPSIVAIHTSLTQTDFFGQSFEGEAAGSGFVWSSDGYIVTNNHVIDGAAEITVTFDDGSSEPAELIAGDPRTDLALLRVERNDLTPLQLGDSDAIRVGDPVVAIGNALDLGAEPTVTGGMVSAKERTLTTDNGEVLVNLLQTDAAISSGNSGGPLLDMNGRVIGINTAVAAQGQNIGFAIAITPAQDVVDDLQAGRVPERALLGVSAQPTVDGSDGAAIAAVETGSAAEAAGIEIGDVITTFDGTPIGGPDELVAAIRSRQPGDTAEVTLVRNGESITVSVELGAG
jgi:S1-C subfamily serine protease